MVPGWLSMRRQTQGLNCLVAEKELGRKEMSWMKGEQKRQGEMRRGRK